MNSYVCSGCMRILAALWYIWATLEAYYVKTVHLRGRIEAMRSYGGSQSVTLATRINGGTASAGMGSHTDATGGKGNFSITANPQEPYKGGSSDENSQSDDLTYNYKSIIKTNYHYSKSLP